MTADTHQFTVSDNMTWAFATPFEGHATRRWALYVSGADAAVDEQTTPLRDELKFAEIVVSTVGSFIEVRELQRQQSVLGQFFSKPVISALADDEDPNEVLAPREVEVTALFCDLRGFSLATELSKDNLLGLLQRVSDVLGVLTHHIMEAGGVIGDFHGDAAMGFWGWPLEQPDAATRAARAAMEICREIERVETLWNFRVGIGIASGRAVAGKIGTVDQVKVTAFGPAVNLASRLEMMTKRLSTTILADGPTASQIDRATGIRTRRLAMVQPYGMSTAIDLWELLPSHDEFPLLTDDDIAHYESALDHFIEGDWVTAWEWLHRVPAGDRSKDFLTTYIASRNRQPPEDWDGVIRLDSK
jgi:adenylate cyclase